MSADVERYLSDVVETARSVLVGNFAGAYAAGSLALDAFHVVRSDVDIAVVCHEPLTDSTKGELIARWRHSALPCPARGLELVVYTDVVARSGTADPGFELELNDGPAMDFRQTLRPGDRPAADGRFWYGLDRSILHQSGRVLAGPPAAEAFTDLAAEDLGSLLVDSLRWWMALPAPAGDEPAAGLRMRCWGHAGRWCVTARGCGCPRSALAATWSRLARRRLRSSSSRSPHAPAGRLRRELPRGRSREASWRRSQPRNERGAAPAAAPAGPEVVVRGRPTG